jgi:hypothetical protein
LAVNTADARVYTKNEAGSVKEVTRQAASSSIGRVQLASSTGALTDGAGLQFDSTNNTLTVNTVLVQSTSTEGVVTNNANPGKPMVLTHNNVSGGGEIIIGDYFGDGNSTKITLNDENSIVTISGDAVVTSAVYTPQLSLQDADASNIIMVRAAATVASNYTLTLPSTAGSNGQVLTTDGTGTTSWTTPSGGGGGGGASVPDFLLFNAGII